MWPSQALISIVIGVGIFLILIFYWRRFSGIKSSTRLHLKAGPKRKISKSESVSEVSIMSTETLEVSNDGMRIKSLNVLFMYNGHSFDAHEILGIPAGANTKMIEDAYRKALQKNAPESKEFIETAYNTLKIHLRN